MKRKTKEEVIAEFTKHHLIICGDYVNFSTKVLTKCCCGKTFLVRPYDVFRKHTLSCGCYNKKRISEANSSNLIGEKFDRLLVIKKDNYKIGNNNGVFWICQCDCGKSVSVPTHRLISKNTKSCGCLDIEKATNRLIKIHPNQKGINHPSYKHGLTTLHRIQRRIHPLRKFWLKKVFEKSNYVCMVCKSKHKLVAHHLDGYHWSANNRWDDSNGICLCSKCHEDFHKKYGYKNNTKLQFEEYLTSLALH